MYIRSEGFTRTKGYRFELLVGVVCLALFGCSTRRTPPRYPSRGRGVGDLESKRVVQHRISRAVQAVVWPTSSLGESIAVQVWLLAGTQDVRDRYAVSRELLRRVLIGGRSGRDLAVQAALTEATLKSWTSADATVLALDLPAAKLRNGLQLLARAFDESAITERSVAVARENLRRSQDDLTTGQLISRGLWRTAFHGHRYARIPGIYGKQADQITVSALRRFFREYLRSASVVVSVTGSVTAGPAVAAIAEIFGRIFVGGMKDVPQPRIEDLRAPRSGQALHLSIQQGGANYSGTHAYWAMAFRIPGFFHMRGAADGEARRVEAAALELLAAVLRERLGGPNAFGAGFDRLDPGFSRRERSWGAVYSYVLNDGGLIVIERRSPAEGIAWNVRALMREIDTIGRSKRPSWLAPVMARVKRRIRAIRAEGLRDVSMVGRKITHGYIVGGDVRFHWRQEDAMSSISAEYLHRLAKRYLSRENLFLSVLTPYIDSRLERDLWQATRP